MRPLDGVDAAGLGEIDVCEFERVAGDIGGYGDECGGVLGWEFCGVGPER